MQTEKAQFQTERATFEIALRELTNRLDRMKESARTAWAESNKWQQRCRDAGLHFDDFDEGTLTGLENIAKIVPCSEKNKGAILQRTHQYILEMQTEKAQFQTERATFEIALRELTNRLDRMKGSARTAWAESNKWQQRCRDAGLHF